MEDWSRTKGEYWSLAWNENNTKPVLTVGNTVSHGGVEVSFKYNQKIAKVVRKHNVELQEQKKVLLCICPADELLRWSRAPELDSGSYFLPVRPDYV